MYNKLIYVEASRLYTVDKRNPEDFSIMVGISVEISVSPASWPGEEGKWLLGG